MAGEQLQEANNELFNKGNNDAKDINPEDLATGPDKTEEIKPQNLKEAGLQDMIMTSGSLTNNFKFNSESIALLKEAKDNGIKIKDGQTMGNTLIIVNGKEEIEIERQGDNYTTRESRMQQVLVRLIEENKKGGFSFGNPATDKLLLGGGNKNEKTETIPADLLDQIKNMDASELTKDDGIGDKLSNILRENWKNPDIITADMVKAFKEKLKVVWPGYSDQTLDARDGNKNGQRIFVADGLPGSRGFKATVK